MSLPTWLDCPIVFIPPPPVVRCPSCAEPGPFIIVRSTTERDGSITRRSVCRHCSSRFLVVVDPDLPTVGGGDVDVLYPSTS